MTLSTFFASFKRKTLHSHYMAEIDGIRFLAIVLVILFHIYGYYNQKMGIANPQNGQPIYARWLLQLFENGDRGVYLFFVLSGFMVSLPFAKHYISGENKVHLKQYYKRRFIRIEPPYLIAVSGIFLVQLATHVLDGRYAIVEQWQHYFASLGYMHGFLYPRIPPMVSVVLWSLEVEIQFYLIAPFLFQVFRLSAYYRRLLIILLMFFFIAVQYATNHHWHGILRLSLQYNWQYFLAGMLLADFYTTRNPVDRPYPTWATVVEFIALLLLTCYTPLKPLYYGRILLSIAYPLVIAGLYYLILTQSCIKEIFSYRIITTIGGMCYSLYLLHYTLIAVVGQYTLALPFNRFYWVGLGVEIVLLGGVILVVCGIYYKAVEQVFMKLSAGANHRSE